MNKLKKLIIVIVLLFMTSELFGQYIGFNMDSSVVEAATMKISQKTLLIESGKTKNLKIIGAKKVTWKSDNKLVAVVSGSGKVTAKDAGNAIITATVNGKKYLCEVTVSPYAAVFKKIGDISVVIPKGWKTESSEDSTECKISPPELNSSIIVTCEETGDAAPAYAEVKTDFTNRLTKKYFEDLFDSKGVISDFKSFDYDSLNGTAYATQYDIVLSNVKMKQTVLDLFIDNYFIEITVTDSEDLDLASVGEYLLDSIKVTK